MNLLINIAREFRIPRRSVGFVVFLLLTSVCIDSSCMAQGDMKFVLMRSGKIVEGKATRLGRETRIDLTDGGYFVVATEKVEKTFRARRDVINYKIAVTPMSAKNQDLLLYWLCKQQAYVFAENHLNELEGHADSLQGLDFQSWRQALRKKSSGKGTSKTNFSIQPNQHQPNYQATFQKNVNRHLVLGCSISGCHNSDSTSAYQLMASLYSNEKTRQSNFNATRAMIQNLGKKKFLAHVSQKHGPLKRGMYPTATREYLAIATWVNSLKDIGQVDQPLVKTVAKPKLKTIPSLTPKSTERAPQKRIQDMNVRPVSNETAFAPRDEFDPEIFNRLQAKKWDVVQKVLPVKERVSNAPQRLISPDKTNSRK